MEACGLYIHIPFCKAKCAYCDFYSVCGDSQTKEAYYNALIKDIEFQASKYADKKFDTLFIGGGTPSVMGEALAKIMEKILSSFNFAGNSEVSVEVNPESVTNKLMKSLVAAGVNRISMGVQTFDEAQLEILGRIHSNNDVFNAVNCIINAGVQNYNLDLMFALPVKDQNTDPVSIWQNTVNKALEYRPTHLSAYSLTLEEHTPLYKKQDSYYFPDEQQEDEMYLYLCQQLKRNGYAHYEISNYAENGYECKHNLKYWEHCEYLGIGPGAHSYINGKRYSVPSDISTYCKGASVIDEYEEINTFEAIYEKLITGLRLKKGVDLADYSEYYDIKKIADFAKKLSYNGLAILNNNRLSLTEDGFRVSNSVINQIDNYRKF